ncbi:hypothetical protein D0Y65_039128, partial [Glycine soja]
MKNSKHTLTIKQDSSKLYMRLTKMNHSKRCEVCGHCLKCELKILPMLLKSMLFSNIGISFVD